MQRFRTGTYPGPAALGGLIDAVRDHRGRSRRLVCVSAPVYRGRR
ncbi:hypothetical protein [Streptomyces sp. NPDC006290]